MKPEKKEVAFDENEKILIEILKKVNKIDAADWSWEATQGGVSKKGYVKASKSLEKRGVVKGVKEAKGFFFELI